MTYTDPDYQKKYRIKNKEKLKEQKLIYTKEHKEQKKKYDLEHIEELKEMKKNWFQTEQGKKSSKISGWKKIGVIHDDYSSLYDYYLNCKNCEDCNVELQIGNAVKNKKCLDHDHKTGLFRNIVCNSCNVKRGYNDRK